MAQARTIDYDPDDSLSPEMRANPKSPKPTVGLYVRCAYCRADLSGYLQPCVDSTGQEYESVYRIQKPLWNACPVFCKDGCWDEVELVREGNTSLFDY
jgi:hypothetical protein